MTKLAAPWPAGAAAEAGAPGAAVPLVSHADKPAHTSVTISRTQK